jgi:hypothetical protein
MTELVEVLRRLGARSPETVAAAAEGRSAAELARYAFLRQAWQQVLRDDDPFWIDDLVAEAENRPRAPFASAGHALKALRESGAPAETLAQLVRAVQTELFYSLCYLLDDPGVLEDDLADIKWGLFVRDEEGKPGARIEGLAAAVLETDPTGRDGRPKAPQES